MLSDLQGLTALVNPVFARGLFLPISIGTGQACTLAKVTSHLFGLAESVGKIASLPSECIPLRYAHSVLSDPQDYLTTPVLFNVSARSLFPAITGQNGRKGVTTFILDSEIWFLGRG